MYRITLEYRQYIFIGQYIYLLAPQMDLDTFDYPIDEQKLQTHIKANRIGKLRPNIHSTTINPQDIQQNNYGMNTRQVHCQDCGRVATDCPEFKSYETEHELELRYSMYGPNCVIYLGYLRRITIFLFICCLIFGLPMIIMNINGQSCKEKFYCVENNFIYRWSVYNVVGDKPGPLRHAYLWLGFCILSVLFTVYLRRYTMITYQRVNRGNTTDSDYSLLLRRLPQNTRPEDIRQLINRQIQNLNNLEGNNKTINRNIHSIIMIPKEEEFFEDHENQLDKFKQLIKKGQQSKFIPFKLKEPTQFGKAAIVRFNDKHACHELAKSANPSCFQNFMNYLCVFYKPKTDFQVRGERISVQKAPHPTDMQWKNFGHNEGMRMLKKTILTFLAFLFLVVCSGVSLGISYLVQQLIKQNNEEPILMTAGVVLVVFIFNRIIRKFVVKVTKLLKFDNKTDEQSQQISLIFFHQSLNLGFFSAIVPLLVKLPSIIKQKTTSSSNFPSVMLISMIYQAIGATLIDYVVYNFQIKQKIRKFCHDHNLCIMTQTQANQRMKGLQVPFVKCYVFNCKMVFFGFLFAVVTPISIFLAFFGMLLTEIFQRKLFNNRYSIPFYLRSRINYEMIDLMQWVPLWVGLFHIFLYGAVQKQRKFEYDGRVVGVSIAMIVIGILNIITPWHVFIKRCMKKSADQINYAFNPNYLQLTYEESNPLTRPSFNVIYRENVLMDKFEQQRRYLMQFQQKLGAYKNQAEAQIKRSIPMTRSSTPVSPNQYNVYWKRQFNMR